MKLKGTEPVESLDLSRKGLGVNSAIVIASLIGVNRALTSLNLSNNQLCGIDLVADERKDLERGAYCAKGLSAIADALRVNGTLMSLNLSSNNLCAWTRLHTYKGGGGLDYEDEDYRIGGKRYRGVNSQGDDFFEVGERLNYPGIVLDSHYNGDLWYSDLPDLSGVKALADALSVNGALTSIDLSTSLGPNFGRGSEGEEARALIRNALQGKAGFKLLLGDDSWPDVGRWENW